MSPAVDYGNARIRARSTRLFDSQDFAGFVAASSLDRLTGMLSDTSYGPEIEAVLPLAAGIRRIDAASALHLEHELDAVQEFYDDPFRSRLETFRERWDVKNLSALVRALSGRSGRSDVVDGLVPTGQASSAVLHELATQASVRAMADVMVSWNIPNIRIAHEIRSSLADYDRTGDPREIEAAIRRGFDREVDAAIESDPGDPLSQMLKAERAKEMLLDAVRFRARRRASGGTVADSSVRNLPAPMRAIVHDDPATAVAELDGLPPGFRAAMDRWTTSDDIRTLADDLDRASAGLAATLYARDPLGLGVPVGYLWQVENEARNLRLVARGVAGEIDRDEVEMRLVMP